MTILEKMYVALRTSMRLNAHRWLPVALLSVLAQPSFANISRANDLPPAGAVEASCIYANQTPSFCKVLVNRARKTITIWYPEGRQSAMNAEYKGKCLKKGCILTGPDYGYPEREKSIIVESTNQKLSWRELNGNNELHVFKFLR